MPAALWPVYKEVGIMKTGLLVLIAAILFVCSPIAVDNAISGGRQDAAKTGFERSTQVQSQGMDRGNPGENQAQSDSETADALSTATIVDNPDDPTTWLQRWDQGQPNPGGIPPEGWYDVAGWAGFQTYQINVIWHAGDDVHLQIFTDFPETGYGDGTPYGYPHGGLYQLADVAFDLDLDGVWDTGVALIDHGAIPADPGGNNPPGYGQPADSFVKGKIYTANAWFSPQDIHYYHWAYAGKYDMDDPKTPFAWMRLGSEIGDAEITYTDLGAANPKYKIDIILRGINSSGKWDHFSIYWGTGNCCNDVIMGTVQDQHEIIPTLNQWGFILLALLLIIFSFWVSKRKVQGMI